MRSVEGIGSNLLVINLRGDPLHLISKFLLPLRLRIHSMKNTAHRPITPQSKDPRRLPQRPVAILSHQIHRPFARLILFVTYAAQHLVFSDCVYRNLLDFAAG